MSFNFKKYEEVARELSKNPCEENIRIAISRAYYYIFHRAKKIAGITFNVHSTHEKVVNGILNNEELDLKYRQNLSKKISDLRQDRVFADYYVKPPHPVKFDKKYLESFWYKFEMVSEWLDNSEST